MLLPFQQKLQSESGFPAARMSLDQVNPVPRKSPFKDVIETQDSGCCAVVGF